LLQGVTSIPIIGIYVVVTILSTYFICTDRLYILDQLEHHFPKLWVKRFAAHLKEITSALGGYLKAEAIMVCISFVIVLVGLYAFKFSGMNVVYPLLAALRNRVCRCTSNSRLRHSINSMGNNFCHQWRYETCHSDYFHYS